MAVRIRVDGNVDTAKAMIPIGRKLLGGLVNRMSFNNLEQDQQTTQMSDGTVFKVKRVFGQDTIDIITPPPEAVEEEVKEVITTPTSFLVVEAKNSVHDSAFIIWDIAADALAIAFTEDAYPITQEQFDFWVNSTPAIDVTNEDSIYATAEAGESNTCEGTSSNTGCGELENIRSDQYTYVGMFDYQGLYCPWDCCVSIWQQTASGQVYIYNCEATPYCQGYRVWSDKFTYYDMQAYIEGPLKSYNLTVQVLGSFVGETTCIRNNCVIFDRDYYPLGWLYHSDRVAECGYSEIPLIYNDGTVCIQLGVHKDSILKTPLGDFTSVHLYNQEVLLKDGNYPCQGTPFWAHRLWDGAHASITASIFSTRVFAQVYGYWGRLEILGEFDTTYEVIGELKGAVDEVGSTSTADPRDQTENTELTNAITNLMDDYISMYDLDFSNLENYTELAIKIYEIATEVEI